MNFKKPGLLALPFGRVKEETVTPEERAALRKQLEQRSAMRNLEP